MKNDDLNHQLRTARVPDRGEDYWEAFPQSVTARLRAVPSTTTTPENHWLPRLIWGAGIALACLIIGFGIGHWRGRVERSDPYALLQNGKLLGEIMTLFPNRVRAIVQDEHGVQLVLADQADVPPSRPIYVHLCTGDRCSSMVTFSGQELDIAGQKVTILANAKEGVIVVGAGFAWSSEQPDSPNGNLKIEARELRSTNL